jgi:hypothetical protein
MKRLSAVALFLCLLSSGSSVAQDLQIRHKEPLPGIQTVVITDPVAVPETIGATLLAAVGFLMMFRRRR